jgi:hypothetical protein
MPAYHYDLNCNININTSDKYVHKKASPKIYHMQNGAYNCTMKIYPSYAYYLNVIRVYHVIIKLEHRTERHFIAGKSILK